MKNNVLTASLIIGLGLSSRLLAQTPAPIVLLDTKFERPNNATGYYPPGPDEGFKVFAGNMSAWTGKAGRMGLTYAQGYGLDGSGGVSVHVHSPSPEFMHIYFRGLPMPMLKDSLSMTGPIRSLQFEVAAKLPIAKTLEVYLNVATPKGMDAEISKRGWANRLLVGTITGTGEFQTYKLSGAVIPDKKVEDTIRYIRDLYLNGMPETICDLTFDLSGRNWIKGDEFLVDNVRLTIASK